MPIIDRRDRNNWYNSIQVKNSGSQNKYTGFFEHPETFDVNKLDVNEFDTGYGQTVAKIPNIPGRITRLRRNKTSNEYYIQLIIGRAYDRGKRQSRNVKVTIGIDVSWHLPGMMQINEKYHQYFDKNGNLYNDPMVKGQKESKGNKHKKTEGEEPDTLTRSECENNKEDITDRRGIPEEQASKNASTPANQPPFVSEELTEEQMLEELKQKQAILDQKIAEHDRLNEELRRACEEHLNAKKELDSIRMIRIVQLQTAEANRISFLSGILDGHSEIVARQAGKNPYVPMSLIQIRMINEILAELKRIFSGVEGEEYLKLAEEPRPDPDDEKREIPGATYGEMAFILQAYISIINASILKRLRYRDE